MTNFPIISTHVVSERNQGIAMAIINRFEIQQGRYLAFYLGVPVCNDNYTSVCLWVQKESLRIPKRYDTIGDLMNGFLNLLPQSIFGG